MNKGYFFAILLLIGGITGCIANTEDDEMINVSVSEAMYVIASKVFVESFNDALYGTICDKLMYEDGSFYNENDAASCLEEANNQYNSNESGGGTAALLAPDWEYMNFTNTGKNAALTGDIYKVSGVGFWCPERRSSDGGGECHGERFTKLYMAKNTDSGNWGYAAEGFRTMDGGYLEVVMPNLWYSE